MVRSRNSRKEACGMLGRPDQGLKISVQVPQGLTGRLPSSRTVSAQQGDRAAASSPGYPPCSASSASGSSHI